MRAITLTQPWATLVALGEKKVETRSWSTTHRGPLAIHAAKALPKSWAEFRNEHFVEVLENECGLNEYGVPDLSKLPTGVVLCVVDLVDVVRMEVDVPPFYGLPGYALPVREHVFGVYGPGRYGWVFDFEEEPMLLDPPLPVRGHQRIWNVSTMEVFA